MCLPSLNDRRVLPVPRIIPPHGNLLDQPWQGSHKEKRWKVTTDPRDLSQATDDELRAADAAAEVRTPRGPDGEDRTPVRPATGAPTGDPRDLDAATNDELRAAAAAASVRVHRPHDDGGDPPQTRPELDEAG